MAISLPDVEQTWQADVAPYVAAMAEMVASVKAAKDESLAAIAEIQAALDALHGSNIDIGVSAAQTAAAAAVTDRLAHSAAEAAGAEQAQAAATNDAAEAAAKDAVAQGAAAAATDDAAKASADAAGASTAAAAASSSAGDAAYKQAAGDTVAAAAANRLADAQRRIAMGLPALEPIGHLFGDEPELWAADAKTLAVLTDAKETDAHATALLADVTAAFAREDANASDALRGIISSMQGAGTATRFFGLSLSALHWIVGVSAEALAVLVPAIIAFGAGAAVAMQGAVNAASHMEALWTAAEATGNAFHQTMGTLLGLKPALQQAQDAANPGVYELLGSAVNDAKAHMASLATAGLQVVHMFDEFSARITVDLQTMAKSGEMQSLLGNMVSDLQELGQVFGNVGHAILNFAADMPGLAEVLLKIVDGISKVILWLSELPRWLIMGAMALEEFYRWGGLAASIIARIGLLLPSLAGAPLAAAAGLFSRLAGIMGSIVGVGAQLVGGLASVAGGVAKIIPAAEGAEGALSGLSKELAEAAANPMLMGEIGLAIAAFAGLALVISHVKDANEQMASSAVKAVHAASDMTVLSTIAQSLVTLGNASDHTSVSLQHVSSTMQTTGAAAIGFSATTGVGLEGVSKITAGFAQNVSNGSQIINSAIPSFGGLASAAAHLWASFTGATKAEADTATLNAAQEQIIGTFRTVTSNIGYLSGAYHIAGSAAVAMAQEAGVNLQTPLRGTGQAAQIARQQIANFVQGLGAMSAPAGVVGNDMEAIGIQSQLAGTKVQQLNQAWDAWMSSVTGSMASFSQVQTAIQGMASDAASSSASLTGSIGSISRSASGMTYTLKGMGADAMQSWQQLTSALNQGNTALDQLRTGMAEGVITGGQFKSTVQGLVGEMIPFVAGNRTATEMLSNLAHEAGGPVTTSVKQLADWTGVKGKAAADQFSKGMNDASIAMGNMSKVAQNLSAVVSSDLDAALAQSITQTSGVATAVQKYAQDLANAHTPASVLHQDLQNIAAAEARENKMTAEASQGMNRAGTEADRLAAKMHTAAYYADALAAAIRNIPTQWTTDVTVVSSQGLHGIAAAGAAAGHASGTPNAAPGLAIVGEQGPELMMLHGGEAIFNATETARMLSGIPSAIFGASAASRASSGGGGGGGAAAGGAVEVHSHVYLDGKQIYESVQQENLRYGTRNAGARTGLMTPGRKVG